MAGRLLWASALALLLIMQIASFGVPTASSTFPGTNGKIAFESNREDPANLIPQIFVMNPDGSGQTNVSNLPAGASNPAWSPDGNKIAFAADSPSDIFVMNAVGSGQTSLTDDPTGDSFPAWSPSGTKIVFSAQRDGVDQLYVMNAEGLAETRLTFSGLPDRQASWSPDGTKIAFTRGLTPATYQVMLINAGGSGETILASGQQPSWSPDGTKIAFSDTSANIVVIKLSDLNKTPLTADGVNYNPVWSPDGTKIAFQKIIGGNNNEIFVMNSDGSGTPVNISNNASNDGDPDWQPLTTSKQPSTIDCSPYFYIDLYYFGQIKSLNDKKLKNCVAVKPNAEALKNQPKFVSGFISPPHTADVTLRYVKDGIIMPPSTTQSNTNGSFSDAFVPNSSGRWSIEASWNGDSDHLGSSVVWENLPIKDTCVPQRGILFGKINELSKDGDINGDGTRDWLINSGLSDEQGNKVQIWCIDEPSYGIYYAFIFISNTGMKYLMGKCPWGDGLNNAQIWYLDQDGDHIPDRFVKTMWSSFDGPDNEPDGITDLGGEDRTLTVLDPVGNRLITKTHLNDGKAEIVIFVFDPEFKTLNHRLIGASTDPSHTNIEVEDITLDPEIPAPTVPFTSNDLPVIGVGPFGLMGEAKLSFYNVELLLKPESGKVVNVGTLSLQTRITATGDDLSRFTVDYSFSDPDIIESNPFGEISYELHDEHQNLVEEGNLGRFNTSSFTIDKHIPEDWSIVLKVHFKIRVLVDGSEEIKAAVVVEGSIRSASHAFNVQAKR